MRRLIFIVLCVSLLSGCGKSAPKTDRPSVVTLVEVSVSQGGRVVHYRYSQEDKMQAVLYYLRSLQPSRSAPIEAETFRTDAYRICLTMSDGGQRVYHQLYDEYLQKDNGPWQRVDQARASSLPQLLKLIPSDEA